MDITWGFLLITLIILWSAHWHREHPITMTSFTLGHSGACPCPTCTRRKDHHQHELTRIVHRNVRRRAEKQQWADRRAHLLALLRG